MFIITLIFSIGFTIFADEKIHCVIVNGMGETYSKSRGDVVLDHKLFTFNPVFWLILPKWCDSKAMPNIGTNQYPWNATILAKTVCKALETETDKVMHAIFFCELFI